MIDYQTYLKLHPHAAAFRIDEAEILPFDGRPPSLDLKSNGSADIHSLMAADTYGFYFTEKKWSQYLQSFNRSMLTLWFESTSRSRRSNQ